MADGRMREARLCDRLGDRPQCHVCEALRIAVPEEPLPRLSDPSVAKVRVIFDPRLDRGGPARGRVL
jgi:hypothetical protein